MSGLPTIEGALFALIGLLLAFTISGGLQRFDERRQQIVQEATAISTAYDRLDSFEGEARDLQSKLKDYTKARIDLCLPNISSGRSRLSKRIGAS